MLSSKHPEAETFPLENDWHSSSALSSKIRRHILKKSKITMCLYSWDCTINHNEMKMKNKSHRYNINRPRPRCGHKYHKYENCLSMMEHHWKLNSWKS